MESTVSLGGNCCVHFWVDNCLPSLGVCGTKVHGAGRAQFANCELHSPSAVFFAKNIAKQITQRVELFILRKGERGKNGGKRIKWAQKVGFLSGDKKPTFSCAKNTPDTFGVFSVIIFQAVA